MAVADAKAGPDPDPLTGLGDFLGNLRDITSPKWRRSALGRLPSMLYGCTRPKAVKENTRKQTFQIRST